MSIGPSASLCAERKLLPFCPAGWFSNPGSIIFYTYRPFVYILITGLYIYYIADIYRYLYTVNGNDDGLRIRLEQLFGHCNANFKSFHSKTRNQF